MKPWAIAAVALLLIGAAIAFTAGPTTLSVLDGLMGGGRGTSRVASGVPFGRHGQTLDVWRPSGGPRKNLPVLIFWYGGGWAHGDRAAYAFAARAFARSGFVVVVPDYRKVPAVRFPAFVQDGADAVRWTVDHVAAYGGDPGAIAVAGHSAGAYTAVMLALDSRWLRAVGVDPHAIRAAIGLCGPYDFYPFTARRAIDAMQGAADPILTQPIHFARADAPPMLLISAGADAQVGAHNAGNLTAALRRLGAPVMHRDYPGLSHEAVVMALSKPFRGKAPVLADSVAFLRANLAPGAIGER